MLKTVGNPSTRYGDQTVIDGNLVIGTAGKGIDFSSDPSAPGMTSELFDDYEEGTWTPTLFTVGAPQPAYSGTIQGTYTKTGNVVTCQVYMDVTFTSGGGVTIGIAGFPFVFGNPIRHTGVVSLGSVFGLKPISFYGIGTANSGYFFDNITQGNINGPMSNGQVAFSITYFV
jgi:hypothetical protein